MLFNMTQYLLFLPIVAVAYYSLPIRVHYIWLLGVSYYFYMQWNPLYNLLFFRVYYLHMLAEGLLDI